MAEDKQRTMAEVLADVRKNFEAIIESQASQALMLRARYDALIHVGFTAKEALEIIKARGMAL